jgi:hypothetical protein
VRCQDECCGCLKRVRDCAANEGGCRDCNQCSDCTILATACVNMCTHQVVLPPQIAEPNRIFVFGERVELTCGTGFELAALLKNDGLQPLGQKAPKCTADELTNDARFEVGMSCLAKP